MNDWNVFCIGMDYLRRPKRAVTVRNRDECAAGTSHSFGIGMDYLKSVARFNLDSVS